MKITFQSLEGFAEEASELTENIDSLSWPLVRVPDFGEEGEFTSELTGSPGKQ